MLTLHIGNKNYSSWSLRPWLALREAGIAFEERRLRLDFAPDSAFKRALAAVAPSGKVPVLVDDEERGADGRPLAVWDTLAIAEYLAEKVPDRGLWPAARGERARARSLCAEMHAGFAALRTHLPMNIEASLPEVGERLLRERADVRADVERIAAMWCEQLGASRGPFLFGAAFGLVDAYFAPVCTRFRTYGVGLPEPAAAYAARVLALPSMRQWEREAHAEADFLDFDEPYRSTR